MTGLEKTTFKTVIGKIDDGIRKKSFKTVIGK